MTKILSFLLLTVVLISCQQETGTDTPDPKQKELENEIAQLQLENSMKDSVINESLAFFNEIKSNLEAIGIRKDQIRTISNDPELTPDDKQWILEEIRHINYLREDNARMVKRLQAEMKKSKIKIEELEIMVESLMKEIQWKDEQIEMLQNELNQLDQQYSALFDAYQEQAIQIDELRDELNTVYYAYGSEAELEQHNIVKKKNGFIGIGRKLELRSDFNGDYFTKVDATKTNEITVRGEDPHIMSNHPLSSYEMIENGASTKIKILDASEFWKVSKYLVVMVD